MEKPRLPHTKQHKELRVDILTKLSSWKRFIIAIDGDNDAGKSSLARYLAWQTGIAVIETDLFMESLRPLNHRYDHLAAAVSSRLMRDQPVIVEGVQILQTLEQIDIDPDYLIVVEFGGRDGSYTLSEQFKIYRQQYKRRLSNVDFRFKWEKSN